jgi:uncharacterized protein (DUF488 family)
MIISLEEFQMLRENLRNLTDLRSSYPRGLLFTILVQKKVDDVKKRHAIAVQKLEEVASFWNSKKQIPRLNLTPVMKIRILLKALGFSKSEISRALKNPNCIEDEKLRDVIWRAIFTDFIYSPLAMRHQFARGKLGEEIIRKWLEKRGIAYEDENDMKGKSEKTPDFLLSEPIQIESKDVNWIESKALFGDPKTHWIYWKRQYSDYLRLFGEGVVVYWFGHVKLDSKIVLDGAVFPSPLRNALFDMRIYTKGLENADKLEILVKNLAISSVIDVGAELQVSNADYIQIPELEKREDFGEYMRTKEFIDGMCKLIDLYSRGRMLVVCREKNWKICHRRHISWVLKNLGFDVIHL